MADRPLSAPLPADLPENWEDNQIVAPSGASVGLSEQHGYNYLMEMVNRAHEAVNTINESFDNISGKRTCRMVVGTSTAGWTQADCDYLCDGTDDQVEIAEAIKNLPDDGGEIAILDGAYSISKDMSIDLSTNSGAKNIVLSGNGSPTVFIGRGDINIIFAQYTNTGAVLGSVDLQNMSFENISIYTQFLGGRASACRFQNSSILIEGSLTLNTEICGNYFHNESKQSIRILATSGGAAFIANNYIVTEAATPILTTAGTQIVSENVITGSGSNINFSGDGSIENNYFTGCGISHTGRNECTVLGNCIQNGDISCRRMADSPSDSPSVIIGNVIKGGLIDVTDWAVISNNTITASEGSPCVKVERQSPSSMETLSPVIIGNCFSGGTFGVHLMTVDRLPDGYRSKKNAFVTGNRFLGQTTASVQIESTWQDCMITNNVLDASVVDNGTNNIVRLNSDDAGGGGSGTAGVSSFKGRSGAVAPQSGDYTAAMVGAIPSGDVAAVRAVTQAEYDALTQKNPATLYLITE